MRRRDIECCVIALVLGACAAAAMAAEAPSAAGLVARMPSDQGIAAAQADLAAIVKQGPDAVKAIAALVVPMGKGDDAKARFALNGLAHYVSRPGAEAERKMVSGALLEALRAAPDAEVKAFLLSMLQRAGKDEAVPALAGLLGDAALCEPATQALLAIRTPAAADAIAKALPAAKGPAVATLLKAVGDLAVKSALAAVTPHAASQDAAVRRVALYALARIADPSSAAVLAKAAGAEAVEERAYATALYLAFARRLAEAGKKDECAKICRELIRTRARPRENNVVADALAALVEAAKDAAAPDLLAVMDSENKQLRAAAIRLTAGLPGPALTTRLVEKMKGAPAETRAEIVQALSRRADAPAQAAVLAALKDTEKAVRLAAIEAAGRVASPEAVTALLLVLQDKEADEVKAAQAALGRMPGEKVAEAAAAALPKAPAPAKVALLELLAARGAAAHADAVFAAASDPDAAVRTAALKALGLLAEAKRMPDLVRLLLEAKGDAERAEAGRAAVRVAERIADPEARADALLAALDGADAARTAALLKVLAQVGGRKALQAAVARTKAGADPAVQDAAIRALADWRDAGAADALLAIARTAAKPAHQVIALRGYFRLLGTLRDGSPAQRVSRYQDGLDAAKRPDEKRLALAGMATLRCVESLRQVATYLDDKDVGADAALAALKIVLPEQEGERPLAGDEVLEIMRKVAAGAKDEGARKRAADYVASAPRPDAANLALRKPVKISAEAQGPQKPELAVDGNWTDLGNSSYWGDRWPSWFQVDLGKPTRIDTVRIYLYWDGGRYYQYTIEASSDEKTWKQVADQSANTRPSTSMGATYTFDAVEARYVRVNILRNSANEGVHIVELQVFAPGTAPKEQGPPPPAPLAPPDAEGFSPLFNGKDLTGWVGATKGYVVENGVLVCPADRGGNLFTDREFADFVLRFEFKLTPGANNGLGIRAPLEGDAAYVGMELQILDDSADVYKDLKPWQYHGSIYGVVPCERGHQKPVGEWNAEEVIARGRHITVRLNGATIVDADLDQVKDAEVLKAHPGLANKQGHIGFLGHGSRVEFRTIRIKELK